MRASLDFRRGLRTSLGLFVFALLGLSVGCASVNKPASADLESGSGLRARLAAQNEETGSPQLEATADEAAEAADQAGEAADANADAVRAQMDANEAEARAVAGAGTGASRKRWIAGGGLGFTASPVAFLMTFVGNFEILPEDLPEFYVGPHIQLILHSDALMLAPTLNIKKSFTLPADAVGEHLARFKPNVQGGLGFAFIDPDAPVDGEVGFLLNFGFGGDYWITDQVGISSNMLFNIIPDDIFNENFVWSWEVLGVRFRF